MGYYSVAGIKLTKPSPTITNQTMTITTQVVFLEDPDYENINYYGFSVDWTGEPSFYVGEDDEPDDYSISESNRFYHQVVLNETRFKALSEMSHTLVPYLSTNDMRMYRNMFNEHDEAIEVDKKFMKLYGTISQTSAIVVIKDGQYSGHIYVWICPKDPTICFMASPRHRVDTIFIRKYPEYLPNVHKYLVEGCKEFALRNFCRRLVGPERLNCGKLLPSFRKEKIPGFMLENSIFSCWSQDLSKSIDALITDDLDTIPL